MSTVKELFDSTDRDAVLAALYAMYEDQAEQHEGYVQAWDTIRSLEPKHKEDLTWIDVELTADAIEDDKMYPDVSGVQMGSDMRYAIEFVPWEQWLHLEVRIKSPEITKTQAVAYLLYEMTFVSFDQETISGRLEELNDVSSNLNDLMDAVEEMSDKEAEAYLRSQGIVPFEEILKDETNDD